MKNLIKKNQIILFTVALMLIVAGYMNYTVNTQSTLKTAAATDSEQYADLGDARLVSGNVASENNEENQIIDKVDTITTSEIINNNIQNSDSEENDESKTVDSINSKTANVSVDQYFSQSRIDRDNMYSQIIDSYQKILNNDQISDEQKNIAETEITNINNKKNAIMIAENLIKNKGFDNVIIFINDKSINIIIKSENLQAEQVAQIQNIIQRELKAEISDIHITQKS